MVIAALVPSWSQSAATKDVSSEVHELVDGGSKYTHRLISVHGCFVKEFEIWALQPCDARFDQFSKYSMWLGDIDQITQQAGQPRATFIAAESGGVLKEGRGDLRKLESEFHRERPLLISKTVSLSIARLITQK